MQNEDIKAATGLISHYDLLLRDKIGYVISYLKSPIFEQTYDVTRAIREKDELKKEVSEVITLASEIVKLVNRNFLSEVTRNIFLRIKGLNSEVRQDIETMTSDLKSLVKTAREIAAFSELVKNGAGDFTQITRSAIEYAKKLEQIEENFEKMLMKSVYAEDFLANADFYGRKIWETRFHNKFYWLYHGTSVLFLRNIQLHGLDPTTISRGIQRALNRVTSYFKMTGLYQRGALNEGFGFDLSRNYETGYVFLTPYPNVVNSARAPDLPAFLYEILNEAAFTENTKEAMLNVLPEEDKFLLRSCWRFGRILRGKNRVITLHIKVDSNFLKYYGVPDIFGNYVEFVGCELDKYVNLGYEKFSAFQTKFTAVLRTSFSELAERAAEKSPMRGKLGEKIDHWTHLEVCLSNVPPEFIYINIQGKLIPIARFTEDMVPYVT